MLDGYFKRLLVVTVFAGLVSSCGSQKLMTGQNQMRSYFQEGNYDKAETIADSLKKTEVYKAKDRVLYALEKGTINYFRKVPQRG
jgi:hypothetical protein